MSQRNLLTHLNMTKHGRPTGLQSPQGSQETPVHPMDVVDEGSGATDGSQAQRSGSTTSEEKASDKAGRAGSTKITERFQRLFGTGNSKDKPRGSTEEQDVPQVPQVPPQGTRTSRRPGHEPHSDQPEQRSATLVCPRSEHRAEPRLWHREGTNSASAAHIQVYGCSSQERGRLSLQP